MRILDYYRRPIKLFDTDAIEAYRILNDLSIDEILRVREDRENGNRNKRYRLSIQILKDLNFSRYGSFEVRFFRGTTRLRYGSFEGRFFRATILSRLFIFIFDRFEELLFFEKFVLEVEREDERQKIKLYDETYSKSSYRKSSRLSK